jgi:hypothetical protein
MTGNFDIDWIADTSPVESVSVDVGFYVSEDFYYGDQNDPIALQSGKWRKPLYKPAVKSAGPWVLISSGDLVVSELVLYYEDVLSKVQRHRLNLLKYLHYFWMRPFLIYDANTVTFPWYGTSTEADRLLSTIQGAVEGEVFFDCDQCWEIDMYALNRRLHIREWDPDYQEEHLRINCPLESLQRQCREMRLKTNNVLDELKTALGDDFWSDETHRPSWVTER